MSDKGYQYPLNREAAVKDEVSAEEKSWDEMSDEERTAKDLMTAEESAEFDIWMAIETSLEDLEVALYLAAWSGPVYKTVQQQAEMDDDDEESVAYKHADRGRSREKAEDAINRLHDLIERIGEAGSVRNFLDGKKE